MSAILWRIREVGAQYKINMTEYERGGGDLSRLTLPRTTTASVPQPSVCITTARVPPSSDCITTAGVPQPSDFIATADVPHQSECITSAGVPNFSECIITCVCATPLRMYQNSWCAIPLRLLHISRCACHTPRKYDGTGWCLAHRRSPFYDNKHQKKSPFLINWIILSRASWSLIKGGFFSVKRHLYEDAHHGHLHTDKHSVLHQKIRLSSHFKLIFAKSSRKPFIYLCK